MFNLTHYGREFIDCGGEDVSKCKFSDASGCNTSSARDKPDSVNRSIVDTFYKKKTQPKNLFSKSYCCIDVKRNMMWL